ncbi:MAG: hypothetical protein FWG90_06725 [Oscillospiraceae bacterium]|nr:hypothetical protein [Oscillospiraceae bacterium]
MPFPVISPAFYNELVEDEKINPENADYCDVYISAAALEYVMYLSEVKVVKKLMESSAPLEFKMAYLSEEHEKTVLPVSHKIINENPVTEYYWQIRVLMMNTLQNRNFSFEKRMLLLNYALKKINGMVSKDQPELIPDFVNEFTRIKDYSETLTYFSRVRSAAKFSLADGISLLKSLSKNAGRNYGAIMEAIYKNLEITPDTLNKINFQNYLKLRDCFTEEYLHKKAHYIENIMVNYVWTYSIPFACPGRLSVWDNYIFFCSLYNALKVLITCYMPGKASEDFANAIAEFDNALRKSGGNLIIKLVEAVKSAGQDNNGDLAILAIS